MLINYSDIIENYLPLKKKVSNAVHAFIIEVAFLLCENAWNKT